MLIADNLDKAKLRPSLVISKSFGKYSQTILAYVTTDLTEKLDTDVLLDASSEHFFETGLRQSCIIKLHRLVTVTPLQIKGVIGELPRDLIPELTKKLKKVFEL